MTKTGNIIISQAVNHCLFNFKQRLNVKMQINHISDLFIFLCVAFTRTCKEIKVYVKVNHRYDVGTVSLSIIFSNSCRNKDVPAGASMHDIRAHHDKSDPSKVC